MSQFLYFLPQCRAADLAQGNVCDRAALDRYGLANVLRDVTDARRDCALFELAGRGPGGLPGVLLTPVAADGGVPARCGYYPAEQTWEEWQPERPHQLPVWIGVDTAGRPGPASLQRATVVPGYDVELGDGQRWTIPIYRRPFFQDDQSARLPRAFRWTPEQRFTKETKPDFVHLWDRAERIWEIFKQGRADDSELAELCVEAIGVNYRVGRAEASILRLIDSQNWQEILEATVDLPFIKRFNAEQEKKTNESPADE